MSELRLDTVLCSVRGSNTGAPVRVGGTPNGGKNAREAQQAGKHHPAGLRTLDSRARRQAPAAREPAAPRQYRPRFPPPSTRRTTTPARRSVPAYSGSPAPASPHLARSRRRCPDGGLRRPDRGVRGHLSARLLGADRVLGPDQPDGSAVRARRACLRRREERRDQGLRLAHGHDADRVRRSQRQRLQLLGPRPARARAGPELPHRPVRVRPLHVRPRARKHSAGTTLGHSGRVLGSMPDAARADRRRLRRERAPVAPSGIRQRDDRVRAGADRGLVPAVSEPLDRRARLRAGRGAVRDRRRRRELQLRRLGAGRHPAEPVRRSAGRRRRRAEPADRRGRRAAQPRPAHRRRSR